MACCPHNPFPKLFELSLATAKMQEKVNNVNSYMCGLVMYILMYVANGLSKQQTGCQRDLANI